MKSIATDNYDFKTLIENGYVYVDKTDMLWKMANGRNGTLVGINFSAKKRNIDEPLIENLQGTEVYDG